MNRLSDFVGAVQRHRRPCAAAVAAAIRAAVDRARAYVAARRERRRLAAERIPGRPLSATGARLLGVHMADATPKRRF